MSAANRGVTATVQLPRPASSLGFHASGAVIACLEGGAGAGPALLWLNFTQVIDWSHPTYINTSVLYYIPPQILSSSIYRQYILWLTLSSIHPPTFFPLPPFPI